MLCFRPKTVHTSPSPSYQTGAGEQENRSFEGVGIRELDLINPQVHVRCGMDSDCGEAVDVGVMRHLLERCYS